MTINDILARMSIAYVDPDPDYDEETDEEFRDYDSAWYAAHCDHTDYSITEGGERYAVREYARRPATSTDRLTDIADMLRDLIEYARDHSSEYIGKPEPVPYDDDGDDICYTDGAHTILCY